MNFSKLKLMIFFVLLLILNSCNSNLITKINFQNNKIRFYSIKNSFKNSNLKFIAKTNKTDFFFTDFEIWKKNKNSGKLIHQLIFNEKDSVNLKNNYLELTDLDKFILNYSDKLNDSLHLTKLKNYKTGKIFTQEIE